MKNVLYFQFPWRLWRTRLAGIYRYAAKAGWSVQMVEYGLSAMSASESLKFWNPDGCIVERSVMELPGFKFSDFKDVPAVYCDPPPLAAQSGGILAVQHDSSQTAAVASRELVALGLANFAFVGNVIPRDWSEKRRGVFAAAAAAAGGSFSSFDPAGADDIAAFFANIRPWLRFLPKPCGILAANDISGDLVLQACRMEKLRVPDDIAVIGIDNDELVCEHTVPTLSSVMPDFEQSGFLAAQLLDDALAGRVAAPCVRSFGATDVVRRNSTRKFRRRDDAVSAALEYIRDKACEGIAPAAVCRKIGGSRRTIEMRFRAFAGRTIGEEIAAVRIERAKSLLRKRNIAVGAVHAMCGYSDPSSFRRAFQKHTGLSPLQWRNGGQV